MREDDFQAVRQSLAKALLLLTSLAVCLLGLELLCRFYLQPHANDAGDLAGPHPIFGRHFKPGQKGRYVAARFDQYIEINSKGLRDREYSYEKQEGVFRILLLADSFGAAMQVPLETAFHSVLERGLNENPALPAVDVINAGYPGWGTAQQTLFYRHEGSKYSPDLVLVAFFVNDVIDNYRWARKRRRSDGSEREDAVELSPPPSRLLKLKIWLGDHLRLYTYVNRRLKEGGNEKLLGFMARLGLVGDGPTDEIPPFYFTYAIEDIPEVLEAWKETEAAIADLRGAVEAHGASLAAVILAGPAQVHDEIWQRQLETFPKMREHEWDRLKFQRVLSQILSDQGIPYLDLHLAFRREADKAGELLHFPFDGHWNAEGHALAAAEIEAWLMAREVIREGVN